MKRRTFQQILGWSMAFAPVPIMAFDKEKNSHTVKPRKLNPGDKIGLITPGSPCPETKIQKAIQNAEMLGLEPVLGKYVRSQYGYLAGKDVERLDDLHQMFSDPSIKAVWCIRGGYGCTRLLPNIDYELIKKNPKIFIGFSDITALHLAFYKMTGLLSLHGPVAGSALTEYAKLYLQKILFSSDPVRIQLVNTKDAPNVYYTIKEGTSRGRLIGGNLSLLAALAGTPYGPNYEGKLVFIEDIGEKPYRIDRMMVQLFQSSDLAKAAGIIFGVFVDCEADEEDQSLSLKETLQNQMAPHNMPSVYGFTFGHMDNQCTLPIGIEAVLNTQNAVLELTESSNQ